MLDRVYNWFSNDYPPLDGRLRFVLYALLFPFGKYQLLTVIPDQLLHCPQELYHPEGLFALIFGEKHSVFFMYQILIHLKLSFLVIWCFCIIGFGGRLALLLNAIFVFIFWGAHAASSGTGHFWHVPLFSFWILAFTLKHDAYSLDFHLQHKIPYYPFKINDSPDLSAFGRKLILITISFIFLSAGISKITLGGLTWFSGSSLYYYLQNLNIPRYYIGPMIHEFLLNNKGWVTVLSVLTIFFETAFISVVFLPKMRLPFVLCAWAFHIGISLVMAPRYFPQMICYIVIINWESIFLYIIIRSKKHREIFMESPPFRNLFHSQKPKGKLLVCLIGLSYILILSATTIIQKEWFPLTHVPMYSTAIDEDKMSNMDLTDFESLDGLKRVVKFCKTHPVPDLMPFYMSQKYTVTKINRYSGDASNFKKEFISFFPEPTLWNTRLVNQMFLDISLAGDKDLRSKLIFRNTQKIFEASMKKILQQSQMHSSQYSYQLLYSLNKEEHLLLAVYND